jgi:hypothetical protein
VDHCHWAPFLPWKSSIPLYIPCCGRLVSICVLRRSTTCPLTTQCLFATEEVVKCQCQCRRFSETHRVHHSILQRPSLLSLVCSLLCLLLGAFAIVRYRDHISQRPHSYPYIQHYVTQDQPAQQNHRPQWHVSSRISPGGACHSPLFDVAAAFRRSTLCHCTPTIPAKCGLFQ